MPFIVRGLSAHPFLPLFALDEAGLAQRGIRRVVADSDHGYPCRVSLQDARTGEALLLLSWRHHEVHGPFSSSGPIFVREAAMRGEPPTYAPGALPPVFAGRLLSLRAYDADGMMRDADVARGEDARPVMQRLLAAPGVACLHVHNARRGCYVARVDPA